MCVFVVCFFKQKTAYEMRISDWSSDVCSSDLSWQDPSNNKAFLDGQVSLTANGISVYYAAKNSKDPKMKAIAEDIQHAHLPIGPIGKPTELMQITQMMLFKHSKYPNAAKAYMQFMM